MSKTAFNHISFKRDTALNFYENGNDLLNSVYALLLEKGYQLDSWTGSHPVRQARFRHAEGAGAVRVNYNAVAPEKSRVILPGRVFAKSRSFEDFIVDCTRDRVREMLAAEQAKLSKRDKKRGDEPKA